MTSLLEPLLKALESSNWASFFVVVAIALLFNLRAISEFLEGRAARHQKFVEAALKLERLTNTSRQFLEEELNYYVFKRITGISADATLREKLRDVIERSAGELQIRQLSRVSQFIRVKEGRLTIVVHTIDSVWAYMNLIFGALVSLIALALFMAPGLVKMPTIAQSLVSVGFGVLFFVFAMFMVAEATPALLAKRIAPVVARLERAGDA